MLAEVDKNSCIGIAESDPKRRYFFRHGFQEVGYQNLRVADNGIGAIQLVEDTDNLSLLVLGDPLPGLATPKVLKQVRKFWPGPVIYAGYIRHEDDVIRSYELGADFYWDKGENYSYRVFVAYAEALMRRTNHQMELSPRVFENDDLTIDFSIHAAALKGEEVALTATQYKLLSHLAHNVGRVISRSEMLQFVWGDMYENDWYLLRANINRLRARLGEDQDNQHYIQTKARVGYMMPDYSRKEV